MSAETMMHALERYSNKVTPFHLSTSTLHHTLLPSLLESETALQRKISFSEKYSWTTALKELYTEQHGE